MKVKVTGEGHSAFLAVVLAAHATVWAQGRGRGGAAAPPQTAKAAALIDLTGYWVSVVTEDWRYRMVTPARGDYQGVPMTPAARAIADAWDPPKEEASASSASRTERPPSCACRVACTSRGRTIRRCAWTPMRESRPGFFHFGDWKAPAGPHTIQGDSVAEWQAGGGRGATDGTLQVTTSNLKAGFLRKNGVPYSENAGLKELRSAAGRVAAFW